MAADGSFLFLIALAVTVGLVGVGYGIWAHFRRKRALRTLAARLGLAYRESGRRPDQWLPFACLRKGSRRRSRNLLEGVYRGYDVLYFDFLYDVQSGKQSHTETVGLACARIPGVHWPDLTIQPEHVGHKVIDALGADDIDFESDEFSRKFWVRSDDRKFAYDVIHPRMMEFLLSPQWSRWELTGDAIAVWDPGRAQVSEIEGAFDRLVGFLELVPARRMPTSPRPRMHGPFEVVEP